MYISLLKRDNLKFSICSVLCSYLNVNVVLIFVAEFASWCFRWILKLLSLNYPENAALCFWCMHGTCFQLAQCFRYLRIYVHIYILIVAFVTLIWRSWRSSHILIIYSSHSEIIIKKWVYLYWNHFAFALWFQ